MSNMFSFSSSTAPKFGSTTTPSKSPFSSRTTSPPPSASVLTATPSFATSSTPAAAASGLVPSPRVTTTTTTLPPLPTASPAASPTGAAFSSRSGSVSPAKTTPRPTSSSAATPTTNTAATPAKGTTTTSSVQEHISAYLAFLETDRENGNNLSPPGSTLSPIDQKVAAQLRHNLSLMAQFEHVHRLTQAAEKLALLETVYRRKENMVQDLNANLTKVETQLSEIEKQINEVVEDADSGHLLRRVFLAGGSTDSSIDGASNSSPSSSAAFGISDFAQQRLWRDNREAFQTMFRHHVDRWVKVQEALLEKQRSTELSTVPTVKTTATNARQTGVPMLPMED